MNTSPFSRELIAGALLAALWVSMAVAQPSPDPSPLTPGAEPVESPSARAGGHRPHGRPHAVVVQLTGFAVEGPQACLPSKNVVIVNCDVRKPAAAGDAASPAPKETLIGRLTVSTRIYALEDIKLEFNEPAGNEPPTMGPDGQPQPPKKQVKSLKAKVGAWTKGQAPGETAPTGAAATGEVSLETGMVDKTLTAQGTITIEKKTYHVIAAILSGRGGRMDRRRPPSGGPARE